MTEELVLPEKGQVAPYYEPDPEVMEWQEALLGCPQMDCPLFHHFTNGMYIRERHVPPGTIFTSEIHLTQHPYTILKGDTMVKVGDNVERVSAGHLGITEPGFHRLVYAHTHTICVTFHPNPDNERDLDVLHARLFQPQENLLKQ